MRRKGQREAGRRRSKRDGSNAGDGERRRRGHGAGATIGESRWIYGVHAVERRLQVDPASVRVLLLAGKLSPRRDGLTRLAAAGGIRTHNVDESELRARCGSDSHQGVAAEVAPFAYADFEEVAAGGRSLLVLDQVADPGNLGALLRTAVAAGFGGVVLPQRGAAGVTGATEKAAAGAVNDISVCRVTNLARALRHLAAVGYWTIALERGAPSIFDMDIARPVALVLGGETGVRRLVLETCDLRAGIPQQGAIESLNASVAGAIAMYEVMRRDLS